MILRKLENSRMFLIALLLGALVLVVLAASDLGGELPNRAELKTHPNPSEATVLVRKIAALFSPATLQALRPATNGASPFYTTHFQPLAPPPKTPDPTPPKPATKKIQLTYQGFYETAGGEKKAFVKVGDGLVVGTVGAKVSATAQTNVLGDGLVVGTVGAKVPATAQTNVLGDGLVVGTVGVKVPATAQTNVLGDGLVVGTVGAKVVADWVIADIALRTLILKNAGSQTNILEFNVPKEIEVPNP